MGGGEGKTYPGEGGRKLFSVRGLLVRFAPPPPPFSPPPLCRSLVKSLITLSQSKAAIHRISQGGGCIARKGAPPVQSGAARVSSVADMTHSCHFPFTSDALVRPSGHLHEGVLSRKFQRKPQKHQGFYSPCEPLRTLENKQKTPKKTKEFRSKKNTKETKTPRKRRTGLL